MHGIYFGQRCKSDSFAGEKCESIAPAEVLTFIEDQLQNTENGEVAPFVKLSTIRKYYCHCLTELNVECVTANATRLKESILNL